MQHRAPRAVAVWLLVMAASGVLLSALDHLPGLLLGAPRRARVFASIEEAERALGVRLWLPSYFPDELAWPPSRVEADAAVPPTVAIRVRGRADGRERLVIAQSLGGRATPPPRLLPPGEVMNAADVVVGRQRGRLVRVLVGADSLRDVWWDQGSRRVTLRYAGPVDRLLLIAASLERQAEQGHGE